MQLINFKLKCQQIVDFIFMTSRHMYVHVHVYPGWLLQDISLEMRHRFICLDFPAVLHFIHYVSSSGTTIKVKKWFIFLLFKGYIFCYFQNSCFPPKFIITSWKIIYLLFRQVNQKLKNKAKCKWTTREQCSVRRYDIVKFTCWFAL